MSSSPGRRVPLVQLSHYTRGTALEKERFIAAFGEGLKEFGFVSVQDHGIDDGLIRRTYAEVQKFFAQPLAVKDRYDLPGGGGQRGYTGYGKEHAKNRKVGDMKEFWHVGRELDPTHAKQAGFGGNVWPEEVPGFKASTLELFQSLDTAAASMLRALAEYFKVEIDSFEKMAVDGNSILRVIHYPPLKDRFIPGAVRASEHEDINLITLLCEGTASGLEILTRDNEWIAVDTLRGQIVVDSGDMLSRVTNGVIPATTHRVVNPPSSAQDLERYSMPFFVHPYPQCVLAPLPVTETPDNPARYPPITADAFLRQRLREIGLIK